MCLKNQINKLIGFHLNHESKQRVLDYDVVVGSWHPNQLVIFKKHSTNNKTLDAYNKTYGTLDASCMISFMKPISFINFTFPKNIRIGVCKCK